MSNAIKMTPIQPTRVTFWIKGTAPLIQHAWSEKALRMMRMTAQERKKVPKESRDPEAEAMAAAYRTASGHYGIPITAFKAALVSAAHKDFGLEKTLLRKAFFVPTDDPERVIPIECDDPVVREDMVRVGANQSGVRYRPQFDQWRCKIAAEVDSELLTAQDIINLVNRAGFSVGVGEWRPEKGGEFGRFEIDITEPFEGGLK